MKKENLVGKRFTRLIVTHEAAPNKYGHTRWACACDCGNTIESLASDLKRGGRPSCGCLKSEKIRQLRTLPEGTAARNSLYAQYRKSARDRSLSFTITSDEFAAIVDKDCHYCGAKAALKSIGATRMALNNVNGNFTYSGIDRKDSNRGYEPGNCLSCCKTCNFAKNDMSYDEFIAYLDRLVTHRKR